MLSPYMRRFVLPFLIIICSQSKGAIVAAANASGESTIPYVLEAAINNHCKGPSPQAKIVCLTKIISKLNEQKETLSLAVVKPEAKEEAEPPPKVGFLDPIANLFGNVVTHPSKIGIELFRSLEQDARPANFAWSRDRAGESVYSTDSALRLSKPGIVTGALGNKLYMDLNFGFEAHASSADKSRDSNSLTWVLGTEGVFHPDGQKKRWSPADMRLIRQLGDFDPSELGVPGVNFLWVTNAFYELNPSTGFAQAGAELTSSLNNFKLGIGRYVEDPWKAFSFRWRPYLGIEGGGVVDDGRGKKQSASPFARLAFRLRGDLVLGFLSERLVASGDYRYWHLLTSSPHSRGLGTISLNYKITDHVYFGGSYADGRRPPSFGKVRQSGAELGVEY